MKKLLSIICVIVVLLSVPAYSQYIPHHHYHHHHYYINDNHIKSRVILYDTYRHLDYRYRPYYHGPYYHRSNINYSFIKSGHGNMHYLDLNIFPTFRYNMFIKD